MKKLMTIMALLLAVVIFGGCANTKENSKTTTDPAGAKELAILTSFYPMYVATINVTKDIAGIRVTNMTNPQTGCLHNYQMTPQDLITLEAADIFVMNGAGMEASIEDMVAMQKNLKIIEAGKGIELLKNKDGEDNPHVWVSVSNAITQAQNISEQLALFDTTNAAQYRANAATYVAKLEALRTKMHTSLDTLQNRNIVTFHEAFPYFAQEFNFTIAAVISQEPDTPMTATELKEIIAVVEKLQVKALFAEPQYSSKAAQTVASATGAKIYELDPGVTGQTDAGAYNGYIDIMTSNLTILMEALG
ncbi:MAG: zinc ABC transporter substrate-binding protein [Clostridiales bacterium]|nr:zinc ABC transporter substrate-binding protein [Clostridiales bacterium]